MTNPAQWPSFDNWSVGYAIQAERAVGKAKWLETPRAAVLIQRWWRQRGIPRSRQHLFPIVNDNVAYNEKNCYEIYFKGICLKKILDQNVFAWEKLDGTNLGVRCDGAIFGRRFQVSEDTYQKIPLGGGILPQPRTIQRVKATILKGLEPILGATMPSLVIYGELMCNASRNRYDERGMARKYYAFGAVLHLQPTATHGNSHAEKNNSELLQALISNGFCARMSREPKYISIHLNDKLFRIFQENYIPCTPMMSQGPLRDVCIALKDKLMAVDEIEGVVLVGQGILYKWKTGNEDESRGNSLLASLKKNHSPAILELAGVDLEVLDVLLTVSGNKPTQPDSKMTKVKGKRAKCGNDDNSALSRAYDSALTKFDSVESFFDRGKRDLLIEILVEELEADLEPKTKKEINGVVSFVKKNIGRSYGVWKSSQGSMRS